MSTHTRFQSLAQLLDFDIRADAHRRNLAALPTDQQIGILRLGARWNKERRIESMGGEVVTLDDHREPQRLQWCAANAGGASVERDRVAFLEKFLGAEALWPLVAIGKSIVTRTFKPSPDRAARINAWIDSNNQTANIYFVINPIARPLTTKPAKTDIAQATWLWVDIDPPKVAGKDMDADALAAWRASTSPTLASLPPGIPGLPTVTVDTGRGYWLYWRLSTPQPVDGGGPQTAHVESFLKGMAKAYGADFASAEISRIARMPLTANLKNGADGCILRADFLLIYDIATFPIITEERKNPEPAKDAASRIVTEAEVAKIRSALSAIPNDADADNDYDFWLEILFACHWAAEKAETRELAAAIEQLVLDWSSCSPKHTAFEFNKAWTHAKADRPDAITIARLYASAWFRGWNYTLEKRPELKAAVALLAAMDRLEYQITRKEEAAKLKIGVGVLDELVESARPPKENDAPDAGQGTRLELHAPEPWGEPVDGDALLKEICDTLKKYVILDESYIRLIALWVVASHGYTAFRIFPRLFLKSPLPECGKITGIDVISPMTSKPLTAENATVAALFRIIESDGPTLFLDEGDSFLRENEEIRGLVNSGHKNGGCVLRVVGEDLEPRAFSTFCPLVIAAIGKLAGTIESRSFMIPLKRRKKAEKVSRFQDKDAEKIKATIARKAARFVADNFDVLKEADPLTPEEIGNRQADNWRPLLAVADCAGGPWPEAARTIAKAAAKGSDAVDDSLKLALLSDLRNYFAINVKVKTVSAADLITYLDNLEARPWKTISHGKTITDQSLSKLLRPYGIKTRDVKEDGKGLKRYFKEDFADPFERYLDDKEETDLSGGF
jgi:hypothetical protein